MLNKKFLIKIMNNSQYRRKFILDNLRIVDDMNLMIRAYAHYVVDYQIINRQQQFEHDKTAMYGFSPIAPICYVSTTNDVVVKMFEMNSINHFLKDKNGDDAVEVAICMITALYNECKKFVKNFDVAKIDAVLTNIEKTYVPNGQKDN